MIMKNFLYILLAAALMMSGCQKPDTPQQTEPEPEPENTVTEPIGKYIFDGKEYPIHGTLCIQRQQHYDQSVSVEESVETDHICHHRHKFIT